MNCHSFCVQPAIKVAARGIAFLLAGCLLLLAASVSFAAAEPEDVYLPLFNLIQQGDFLKTQGHPDLALPKYQQAIDGLRRFQINYPTFNPRMIAYRSNDVAQKLAALATNTVAEDGPSSGGARNAAPSASRGGGAGPGTSVKLLAPGGEPRKALRLHPKQGDKQTASMTIKMAMAMNMGGSEMPMKIPAMTMTLDTTIEAVKPDGDIQYSLVISDVSVAEEAEANAATVDALKNALGGLKGVTGTGVMTSRGLTKGVDLKMPAGADPQLSTMMEQMKETMSHISSPLPEEPVGSGAKWEVKMTVKSQGMTMNETATVDLVSAEEDKITTKQALAQTAPAQKIQNPAMPGIKLDLLKMNGTGSGEVVTELGRILPLSGNIDMHSEMSMGMNQGGQKQTMDMKVDLTMKLESK